MEEEVPRAEAVTEAEFFGAGMSKEQKHNLPWAFPSIDRATNEGERSQLAAVLEPFQTFEIVIRKKVNSGENKVRDFFVYALIPGLTEKIPIIGFQETRKYLNGKLAFLATENFIFTGEEKKKVGTSFHYVPYKKAAQEFDCFSNEWRRIISGSYLDNNLTLFDELQTPTMQIAERKSSRNTISYNATTMVFGNRMIATIDVNFSKQLAKKNFESIDVHFVDVTEEKYPLLLGVLLLAYGQRMI